MLMQLVRFFLVVAAGLAVVLGEGQPARADDGWQSKFDLSKCTLQTTGRNPYFVLEPGFQLLLQDEDTKLQITVLDQTEVVDGVTTRVVEEREWKDGKLYEVARNYFAICAETKDVFYFGEDVDFYEGQKIVNHDGSWRAGKGENRAGLMMPGMPKVGMKFHQEWAPGVAMDRAEIVSVTEKCKTPAGTFSNCLKVKEQSVQNFLAKLMFWDVEYKYHAPAIGLVMDEDLRLTKFGKAGQ